MPVADPGVPLGVEFVQGALEPVYFVSVERSPQVRFHEHARRLPCAGLAAILGPKPEVTRRQDEADARRLRLRHRFPRSAEQYCARHHAELPAGQSHARVSSDLTYNRVYRG